MQDFKELCEAHDKRIEEKNGHEEKMPDGGYDGDLKWPP